MTSDFDSNVPTSRGTGGMRALMRCIPLDAGGIVIDDNTAYGRAVARGDGS